MNNKYIIILNIICFALFSFIFFRVDTSFSFEQSLKKIDDTLEKLARIEEKADEKAWQIQDFYNKAKNSYNKGNFEEAIINFKQVLVMVPGYEPAEFYLKTSIMRQRLKMQEDEIQALKVNMADLVADYSDKVNQTQGLTLSYLLEQALLRCQAGDYKGAEYYYNLCYKLDPKTKDQVDWFINTTYELKELSESLDEAYRKVEELPDLDIESLEKSIDSAD